MKKHILGERALLCFCGCRYSLHRTTRFVFYTLYCPQVLLETILFIAHNMGSAKNKTHKKIVFIYCER